MMLKRTAKSCGSGAPMLASSLREEAQATVSNKPGHRGDHEVRRKTIARGMPGLFRCTCGDYARVLCLISHARLWVHWAPGIPCALCLSRREQFLQNLGRIAPRDRGGISSRLFENQIRKIERSCRRSYPPLEGPSRRGRRKLAVWDD